MSQFLLDDTFSNDFLSTFIHTIVCFDYKSLKMRNFSKYSLLLATLFVALNTMASTSKADVVVFDRVTTIQTPIKLIVLTKGKLFPKGGRLVDIYVDNEKLKKILTGGDGYGFLNYLPDQSGLKKITAHTSDEKGSGMILILEKNDKAVLIEIGTGFKDPLLMEKTRDESRNAIEVLSTKFKIIYLIRYFSDTLPKKWLKKNNLPDSVVIRWKGAQTLKALKAKGVNLYAIIGSEALMSPSVKYIENRYCFEKTKDGKTVADWKEIEKLLNNSEP